MKFLIADDHALVRRGLRDLLAQEYPQCEFVEAGNVPEAIEHIRRHRPDLVLLDISMPGGSGLDVLVEAAAIRPDLPILVVSMHSEDLYGPRAVKAGAAGYLIKDAVPEKLIAAAETLLAGGRYFSAYLATAGMREAATDCPCPAVAGEKGRRGDVASAALAGGVCARARTSA